jgi:transcriptional regulator with XRE-family HTH domain
MTPNNFPTVFKNNRTAAKLTQRFIAEQLQVSQTAVYLWESGRALPSLANLVSLERLFGVQQGELLIAAAYPLSLGERGTN